MRYDVTRGMLPRLLGVTSRWTVSWYFRLIRDMDTGRWPESSAGTSRGCARSRSSTVIAAHAGVPFLRGGFVGVDVFYVISGYLIAGLLYREVLLTGRVSIGAFWARRARRILPAATLVTVVTVLLSLAWMSLVDARQVVVDALWASAFAANVQFAQQGVYYFAEGQRSLAAAALLVARGRGAVLRRLAAAARCAAWRSRRGSAGAAATRVERLPRSAVLTMLVFLTLASLLWSVHATVTSPASAYFSTLTRAWELGVGAMVALVPPTFLRRLTRLSLETIAVIGALMLLTACMLITPQTPFPGFAARAAGGRHRDADHRRRGRGRTRPADRSSRGARRSRRCGSIGDWSYSLYLWHWPAFILAPIALGRALTLDREGPRGPGGHHALGLLLPLRRGAVPLRAGPRTDWSAGGRWCSTRPARCWWSRPRSGPGHGPATRGGEHGNNPPITVGGAADRRAARQHRGAGARLGDRGQGQAGGAQRPHPRPAQPARLDRRRRRLRLRGQRPQAVPARATAAGRSS